MAEGRVEITGVQTGAGGETLLVEVQADFGGKRLQLGQAGPLSINGTVHGLAIDGLPTVLVSRGDDAGAICLRSALRPPQLPTVEVRAPEDLRDLDRDLVRRAIAPILPLFVDGLYSITVAQVPKAEVPGPAFLRQPRDRKPKARVIDPGLVAPDDGHPIVVDLADGWFALLGGRNRLQEGATAWVVAADLMVEASGFTAEKHDRAAREAFARSPTQMFSDGSVRDAIAEHCQRLPGANLGPLTLDRLEPAAQLATAILAEVAQEEGITDVGPVRRERIARSTEFRARVAVDTALFDLALITDDGRRIHEAVVRSGHQYRATGLRPSGRAIGRCLRALVRQAQGEAPPS